MRRVSVAVALAALLPVAARAEPISVRVESSSSAFTQTGTSLGMQSLNLATVPRGGIGFFMSGFDPGAVSATFTLEGTHGRNTLRATILSGFAGGVGSASLGFALWNNGSGGGGWQNAFLDSSAAFAGGRGTDETVNRGLILLLSGLTGAENARVTLNLGGSNVLALSADAVSGLHSPEPASMILIGTGLIGVAGIYRRRRLDSKTKSTDANHV